MQQLSETKRLTSTLKRILLTLALAFTVHLLFLLQTVENQYFESANPEVTNDLAPSRTCSTALVTIVTSYYRLGDRSKHSDAEYKVWTRNFFKLNDAMVVFTDAQTFSYLRTLRPSKDSCAIFIIQNLNETYTAGLTSWSRQLKLDPEAGIHYPELYIIWNQKSDWLHTVAQKNPFKSTHFFWADSGQFRSQSFTTSAWIRSFTTSAWIRYTDFIPSGKILVLCIEHFKDHEIVLDSTGKVFFRDSTVSRLGGGTFGGDTDSVERWRELFYRKLQEYLKADIFAGKDQMIMASICIEHSDLCWMVDGDKVLEADNVWFALQPILAGKTQQIPIYIPHASFSTPV